MDFGLLFLYLLCSCNGIKTCKTSGKTSDVNNCYLSLLLFVICGIRYALLTWCQVDMAGYLS